MKIVLKSIKYSVDNDIGYNTLLIQTVIFFEL